MVFKGNQYYYVNITIRFYIRSTGSGDFAVSGAHKGGYKVSSPPLEILLYFFNQVFTSDLMHYFQSI